MPIFSLRSVRRMLDELAPSLSFHRVNELEAKMRSRNDQTVPAEWEIAVGFALSRVGKVVDPGTHRSGNPDFIFLPHGSSREIVVEITSLSDENADRENPVDDFAARLRSIATKSGISPILGGLSWNLGDVEVNGRVVLGIPERRDIDGFFKSGEFRAFLRAIKKSPSESRTFEFEARGAKSVISFIPGDGHRIGGGYRSYKVARRLDDSGVFNRLKNKEKQISRSALDLPAIVFLCDNDSHVLQHSQLNAPGTYSVRDIVSTFLDGRPHQQLGSWILQKGMPKLGNHVDAVITLTAHQPWGLLGGNRTRELRGQFIPASYCEDFIRSQSFLQLMNAAIAQLPVPKATAGNAMRTYRRPAFFGGGTMTGNNVKISLLTLQKLLAGEISYDEFAQGHGMLSDQLRRLTNDGRVISSFEIGHQSDADDDWVTLKFDGLHPDWLFRSKSTD